MGVNLNNSANLLEGGKMTGRIELVDENDKVFLIIEEDGTIISEEELPENKKKKEEN